MRLTEALTSPKSRFHDLFNTGQVNKSDYLPPTFLFFWTPCKFGNHGSFPEKIRPGRNKSKTNRIGLYVMNGEQPSPLCLHFLLTPLLLDFLTYGTGRGDTLNSDQRPRGASLMRERQVQEMRGWHSNSLCAWTLWCAFALWALKSQCLGLPWWSSG